MKLMNKTMFALLALLGVTNAAFGYQYGISNFTDIPLVVRLVERQVGMVEQYAVLESMDKRAFNFDATWCLKSIEAVPFNPNKRWTGNDRFKGKNLMEIQNMGAFIQNGKYDVEAHRVFGELARTVAMASVEIKMTDNETFKNTAKAAVGLVSGLDTLACKVTDIAMKSQTGGLVGADNSNLLDSIGDIIKKPEKELRDSKKDLIETKELVSEKPDDKAAQAALEKAQSELKEKSKLVQLNKFNDELFDLFFNDDDPLDGYKKVKVPAAIALVEKNKELLGPTTSALMKLEMDKGANEAAMKALGKLLSKTKAESGPATPTAIEAGALVQGCCGVNTYADTDALGAFKDPKSTCSFGLGQIAEAAATLTRDSLCQNRDFMLVPTGRKAERIEKNEDGTVKAKYKLGIPGVAALTTQGE